MARLTKTSKKKEFHILPQALEKDVEYGLAATIEEAKANAIKTHQFFFGKDVKVYFDGVL